MDAKTKRRIDDPLASEGMSDERKVAWLITLGLEKQQAEAVVSSTRKLKAIHLDETDASSGT